ncbi:MAG TPA: Amuc_1100 family pilus-like protein [Candidatus Paceibacterota bacterium]|nr:Amuc_1100 family pilus-like protein [Candidatus Paceibacterota bacterium]
MNWIKRNKFFSIALVLAMGMLGAAGFYDWQSWSLNEAKFDRLDEIYTKLSELKPSSGNEDNIAAAQEQTRRLRAWNVQARNYFQPIEPIPSPARRSSEEFSQALSRTIAQMQHDAAAANVSLPPDYAFSFTAERNLMTFAPGSLGPLAEQLGEAKTITGILYAAQINTLESLQRVPVSADDTAGQQSDYIADSPETNDLAVLTPWQITFLAFTPEIAQVLDGFVASPHAIIVKGINVQPAEATGAAQAPEDNNYNGFDRYARYAAPAGVLPRRGIPAQEGRAIRAGRGGLQTVLDERLLSVTIEIEIVRLTPGN